MASLKPFRCRPITNLKCISRSLRQLNPANMHTQSKNVLYDHNSLNLHLIMAGNESSALKFHFNIKENNTRTCSLVKCQIRYKGFTVPCSLLFLNYCHSWICRPSLPMNRPCGGLGGSYRQGSAGPIRRNSTKPGSNITSLSQKLGTKPPTL